MLRLDPFALPVRYTASDAGADERMRLVELDRERVVLRRAVSGIPMAVKVPVRAFLGVAVHLQPAEAGEDATVAVRLEHRDPGLSVPLFVSADGDDVSAEWQLWGRVLGLPLLVADSDGTLREPFARMGGVSVGQVAQRRRRQNAIKERRPSILRRRKVGVPQPTQPVHREEREIIARN